VCGARGRDLHHGRRWNTAKHTVSIGPVAGHERVLDPRALKDWWAFLLAALTAYGLVPRLLLWQFAAWRSRAVRRALPLDHGDCQVAYERLTRCLHGWCGPGAREVGDGGTKPVVRPADGAAPRVDGAECSVVTWADVPVDAEEASRLGEARFGWSVTAVHASGGREMNGDVPAALAEIGRSVREGPVVILCEAWEG